MKKIRSTGVLAAVGAACAGATAQPPDLLVSGLFTGKVYRYDGATGASAGVFTNGGALLYPSGMVFAPDGALLVGDAGGGRSTATTASPARGRRSSCPISPAGSTRPRG